MSKAPFEKKPDEELLLTPDQAVKMFRRMRRVTFRPHVMTFAPRAADPQTGYRAEACVELSCQGAISFVRSAYDRKQFVEEDVRVQVYVTHPSYEGGTSWVFIGAYS